MPDSFATRSFKLKSLKRKSGFVGIAGKRENGWIQRKNIVKKNYHPDLNPKVFM